MQNSFYRNIGKRLFDIVVSSILLVLLIPFFIVIGIVIKLTSKGDIFYIQKRVGENFKEFDLYKFRSMKNDNNNGLLITSKDDPRITSIGKFIRKTKIDELPQLFNVLKGDMSLVGPRPEVKKYVDYKKKDYEKILTVKPGITDWAAIKYRDEEEILASQKDKEEAYKNIILPKKIELYYQYIDNITFQNDLKIILNTVKVI